MMWEYDTIVTDNIKKDTLNIMGLDGWEHYHVDGNTHYFKRQSHDQMSPLPKYDGPQPPNKKKK